ncbi:LOW QUALITY PROTEIN: hypothetical protein IFM47457_01796, partial [Aspergillus lentulus]
LWETMRALFSIAVSISLVPPNPSKKPTSEDLSRFSDAIRPIYKCQHEERREIASVMEGLFSKYTREIMKDCFRQDLRGQLPLEIRIMISELIALFIERQRDNCESQSTRLRLTPEITAELPTWHNLVTNRLDKRAPPVNITSICLVILASKALSAETKSSRTIHSRVFCYFTATTILSQLDKGAGIMTSLRRLQSLFTSENADVDGRDYIKDIRSDIPRPELNVETGGQETLPEHGIIAWWFGQLGDRIITYND